MKTTTEYLKATGETIIFSPMKNYGQIVSNRPLTKRANGTVSSSFPYGSTQDQLLIVAESMGFSSLAEALHSLPLSEEEIANLGEGALDRDMATDMVRGLLHNELMEFMKLDSLNASPEELFPDAGERDMALSVLHDIHTYGKTIEDRGAEYWVKHLDPSAKALYPLEGHICQQLCKGQWYLPMWYRTNV